MQVSLSCVMHAPQSLIITVWLSEGIYLKSFQAPLCNLRYSMKLYWALWARSSVMHRPFPNKFQAQQQSRSMLASCLGLNPSSCSPSPKFRSSLERLCLTLVLVLLEIMSASCLRQPRHSPYLAWRSLRRLCHLREVERCCCNGFGKHDI